MTEVKNASYNTFSHQITLLLLLIVTRRNSEMRNCNSENEEITDEGEKFVNKKNLRTLTFLVEMKIKMKRGDFVESLKLEVSGFRICVVS